MASRIAWSVLLAAVPVAADEIVLQGNTARAVVIVDGMTDACVNDDIHTGTASVTVGNLRSAPDCPSEVLVFSEGRGAVLRDLADRAAQDRWTDSPNDVLTVEMPAARVSMQPIVWIVVPPARREAMRTKAEQQLALADHLLRVNRAGVAVLADAEFRSPPDAAASHKIVSLAETLSPGLPEKKDPPCACESRNCQTMDQVLAKVTGDPAIHETGRLNVYYLDVGLHDGDMGNLRGVHARNCGGLSSGVVMIGNGVPETLAHEIGHALSLGHSGLAKCSLANNTCNHHPEDFNNDSLADLPMNNIMWAGWHGRDDFSIGQVFRMSFSGRSLLNSGMHRPPGSVTRSCGDESMNQGCPWLGLRPKPAGELLAGGIELPGPTAARPEQVILQWLRCEDCVDGELADVLALGDRAVDPLVDIIQAARASNFLEAGTMKIPDLQDYARVLDVQASSIGRAAALLSHDFERREFVAAHLQDAIQLYGTRAGFALRSLGSDRAQRAARELGLR